MAIDTVYTLQTHIKDNFTGLLAQHQLHFKQNSESVSSASGKDLVDNYMDNALSAYVQGLHNDYHVEGWRVIESETGLTVYEFADPDQSNGFVTGDKLSPMLATVLSIRTAHPGRTGRGRAYLGPHGEAHNTTTGNVSGDLVTLNGAYGAAIITMEDSSGSYAGFDWGLWSKKDAAFYPLSSFVARSYWATQRGRAK